MLTNVTTCNTRCGVLLTMVKVTIKWFWRWWFHVAELRNVKFVTPSKILNQMKTALITTTISDWIKLTLHDSFIYCVLPKHFTSTWQFFTRIYPWFPQHFATLTFIRELEDEEEGQGLGEFKNLENYLSVPANLWNYFSRLKLHWEI